MTGGVDGVHQLWGSSFPTALCGPARVSPCPILSLLGGTCLAGLLGGGCHQAPSTEEDLPWSPYPPSTQYGQGLLRRSTALLVTAAPGPRAVRSLSGNAAPPPRTKETQNVVQGGLPAFLGWGPTAAKCGAE